MTTFASIHDLVSHITSHYSRFADHTAGKVHTFNQLARFACYMAKEPAARSAFFAATINPALVDWQTVEAVLEISCDNPSDWFNSTWSCIPQSKEGFELTH